jgi:hypothetical protein
MRLAALGGHWVYGLEVIDTAGRRHRVYYSLAMIPKKPAPGLTKRGRGLSGRGLAPAKAGVMLYR